MKWVGSLQSQLNKPGNCRDSEPCCPISVWCEHEEAVGAWLPKECQVKDQSEYEGLCEP